jgi:hypothetical protein
MCRCIWGCAFRIICVFEASSGWHIPRGDTERIVILPPRDKNNPPQRHRARREHNNVDLTAEVLTTARPNLIVAAKRKTPIIRLIAAQNYLLDALGDSVVNILAWFDHSNRRIVIIKKQ